jgi:hypothetical protein
MSASEIMPSQGTSTFDLFALRYHFAAPALVHFPPGETANLFRGQFGKILYRRHPCVYIQLFTPAEAGPSGLHLPPKPFVLRVRHLEGAKLSRFHMGLNLFEPDPDFLVIRDSIAELGRESLRAELTSIEGEEVLRLPLSATRPAGRVRIHFLSPTELKNASRPEFGPLFSRIRDRISTLRALYGWGPLEIDFKAIGERAGAIRMTRCDLRNIDRKRVSRANIHPLGGFTGVAEYEGDLTEFIPYLEIAGYTGVGRQTVWGKGEISIETF